jgi:hypothetical protein
MFDRFNCESGTTLSLMHEYNISMIDIDKQVNYWRQCALEDLQVSKELILG